MLKGIPGAGKSTMASALCKQLNGAKHGYLNDIAVVVGMDGFHLTRTQLDQMKNPEEAHRRRGAPWTFDAKAFVDFVQCLQQKCIRDGIDMSETDEKIHFPTFDHAIKDPVPDGGVTLPQFDPPLFVIRENDPSHRIILIEGIYVTLDEIPWSNIQWDLLFFLDVPWELARRRLIQRHMEAGIVVNEAEAIRRVDGNDSVNARLVERCLRSKTLRVVVTQDASSHGG